MSSFTLPDGRRLAFVSRGSGRPLVLIHGWSMSAAVFSEILESLAAERLVLVPDLPGHGASDPGPAYDAAALAGDLEAWLLASGHREIDLIGWSLGGQVALELARLETLRVRRLLLVATTPCFVTNADWPHGLPAGQVRAMARDLRRDYPGTLEAFFHLQFGGDDLAPESLESLLASAFHAAPRPPLDAALAALEALRRADLRGRLTGVVCPTLVHQGSLDRITMPAAAQALAEGLPAGRLHLVPGVGHAPFLSRPGETLELWREFLR